ncbi:kinase-like domain-containing protein [Neohortaea acidophila]|uniref:non-specific serine/threonine protein kinase n=1 Tax=Neohortaea acidophila TaxID=245834 RepID=A0A6A6PR82_9PEZI|nr:kinase-like domain-containing protein [Neohortaea acidophila]KAF2482620.1 kinase-like domain-containing protein [Neohortaea acidophila]
MDRSRLAPDSSLAGEKKQKAIQEARDAYKQILTNCERTNTAVPPYDFIELIGKGAFGRVYKCKERATGELVAIKIVDTDVVDYQQNSLDKDDTIRDFQKEVRILQQLKDSNARNVNMIHEAFDLQQQLWIVSDYCTGGSIRTLMRAQPPTHPGLEEQYIIPISRELALAMKSVHDIGVIHRDIKCTNVYVTEDGEIQLGDFGIVGVLDDGVSKRQTMIGTPHYMPREMLIHGTGNQVAEAYGTEVDVWSFGCTVYEMATGQPPNAVKRQDNLRNELLNAPRLEGEQYSAELRDFVAYCLNSDPQERPTAEQVLRHPYIVNTSRRYATRKLVELIHRFKAWEYSGGWRQSLFFAGGAPPIADDGDKDALSSDEEQMGDWNFSTSDRFNEAFEKRYSQMFFEQNSPGDLRIQTTGANELPPLQTNLSQFEQLQQRHQEMSAERGERSLDRIFSPQSEPYELHTPVDISPVSDLPLRNTTAHAPTRESLIDLDAITAEDLTPSFNFDFSDIPTLKAKSLGASASEGEADEEERYDDGETEEDRHKRATMDWKFPATQAASHRATMDWKFPATQSGGTTSADAQMTLPAGGKVSELTPSSRPALKHSATEPVGQFLHASQHATVLTPVRDSIQSMIDLDLGLSDPAEIKRPGTASSLAESTMTDQTSGNPFDLEEDPAQNEIDRHRFSHHKQWRSDGGQMNRGKQLSAHMHERGSSLSSTGSEAERGSTAASDDVFDFEYGRAQMNGAFGLDRPEITQWPDFSGTDSEYEQGYEDSYDESRAPLLITTNGNGSVVDYENLLTEIEFPQVRGPDPDVLREGADPYVVQAELDRLIDGLGESFAAVVKVLEQFAAPEQEAEEAAAAEASEEVEA